ncbi:MAG: bifunctional diguanylate cyclase/phosphodiesterase [Mycobacterium sp.]|nr:bifunctional diguanylate cyclase/phosphodiesterase [Mycobacterium sp.]
MFLAFAAWLLSASSQADTVALVDDVALAVLVVPAVIFAVGAARTAQGRSRAAWVALAIGLGGWFVGEVLWTYYEIVLDQPPFPSPADAGFLVFPVGACAALLLFPDDYSHYSVGRVLLDGLIVAGSLFLVSWVVVLSPLYEAGAQDPLGFVISVAYPVSDVVILTVATMVVIRAETRQRLVLMLLTVGMACIAVADSGFAYLQNTGRYSSGNLIDLGWAAGFLLITVAGAAGREGRHREDPSDQLPGWASAWLPYVPLVLAALVAAAEPPHLLKSAPVVVVGIMLVMAVMGRQFLAVGENRRLLTKVTEQARHDPLTGLANRTPLYERLHHAMQLRERDVLCVGVLSLDLNDFKLVNDTFGHQAGDELLTLVAKRLVSSVRASDTVARLGGDEFVVLVEGAADQAHLVAERVLGAFDEPFTLGGHEVAMLPSIGLAIAGADEPDLSVDELLRRADVAMYASKKLRVRRVQTFAPQMRLSSIDEGAPRRAEHRSIAASGAEQFELLGELRGAVDRSELTLRYQPQIDLNTRQIVGVEALVRWAHPTRGLLGADAFLPLVRRYGLMESVNDFVLKGALDDARVWHDASIDIPVAVNLFAPTLANLELPGAIAKTLADRGLSAATLTLEITEDMVLADLDRTKTVFQQLRSSGVRIALDDCGSGHSTLTHLRDLPFDQLKLAYDFFAPMLFGDERAASVVDAVVTLAHSLGATIVAEGVENDETAARLREYGCDAAQGYFYSPPVTANAFLEMTRTETTAAASTLTSSSNPLRADR